MPSMSECRQPYLLSNFDFVTESLTLIAGNSSVAALVHLVQPVHAGRGLLGDALDAVGDVGPPRRVSRRALRSSARMTANSSLSVVDGSGTAPAFSNSTPLCTSSVASPPSSRIMFGSVAVGPAQHLLGAPPVLLERLALPGEDRHAGGASAVPSGPTAIAAAAWSWVEKMLQRRPAHLGAERDQRLDQHRGLHRHVQRTGDPRAGERLRCRRTRARIAIRPGISCSARVISLRPKSASDRSATLKSMAPSLGEHGGQRRLRGQASRCLSASIGATGVGSMPSARPDRRWRSR